MYEPPHHGDAVIRGCVVFVDWSRIPEPIDQRRDGTAGLAEEGRGPWRPGKSLPGRRDEGCAPRAEEPVEAGQSGGASADEQNQRQPAMQYADRTVQLVRTVVRCLVQGQADEACERHQRDEQADEQRWARAVHG
jgi:hypothetical protein